MRCVYRPTVAVVEDGRPIYLECWLDARRDVCRGSGVTEDSCTWHCKTDEMNLVAGTVLQFSFVKSSSSTTVFIAARSPPRKEWVPCMFDTAECVLLIELSYFDSMKISRESSMFEVEPRVCGVRPARPIP